MRLLREHDAARLGICQPGRNDDCGLFCGMDSWARRSSGEFRSHSWEVGARGQFHRQAGSGARFPSNGNGSYIYGPERRGSAYRCELPCRSGLEQGAGSRQANRQDGVCRLRFNLPAGRSDIALARTGSLIPSGKPQPDLLPRFGPIRSPRRAEAHGSARSVCSPQKRKPLYIKDLFFLLSAHNGCRIQAVSSEPVRGAL